MAFQDDTREIYLVKLFDLEQRSDRKRGDIDAFLNMDGLILPFELKTTSTGNVTTVRDFGPDHIAKWRDEHWLIGVYDRLGQELKHVHYGSPRKMQGWIQEKEEYIRRDFELADIAPELITEAHLDQIMGHKTEYSIQDAKLLHKKQYSVAEYDQLTDLPGGKFSRAKMLDIVKARVRYITKRGSTLNNPHIPESYFEGWSTITEDHANTLRRMVREELD